MAKFQPITDSLPYIQETLKIRIPFLFFRTRFPSMESSISWAPYNVNPIEATRFEELENPISVKPKDVYEINKNLEAPTAKIVVKDTLVMDGTIELYGK